MKRANEELGNVRNIFSLGALRFIDEDVGDAKASMFGMLSNLTLPASK
jgi:hypothetical protein